MNRRPILLSTAAIAAFSLCALSGTAAAAAVVQVDVGKATSGVSLLRLTAAGHDLRLGDIALTSDTIVSPRISSVTVTPITADGTTYGAQTVNQASSPKSIPATSSPAALASFAALTSPAFDVTASSVPSAHVGTESLGTVSLLGLPVSLAGAVSAASSVTKSGGAVADKTVTVENLALPSIADILGALGLDLSKLPAVTLNDLVNELDLATAAIAAGQAAVDTAQAAFDTATSDLATKTTALTAAEGSLTTGQATLATATTALGALITANSVLLTPLGITDVATLLAASPVNLASAEALVPTLAAALSSYTTASNAVTAAQTAVAAAQALVDTAQATLTAALAALNAALAPLVAALLGVLDGTPLVSLGQLELTTRAIATSASAGGQQAEVVGGTLTGLKVLGTDVLDTVLGNTTLDLDALVGSALTQVTAEIAGLTGTLSSVLSNVPGFPALDIPAPVIGVLTKTTSTSIAGGFGHASAAVTGLSITIPAITLPTALALPGAAALPALDGVTQVAGLLSGAPVSLGLATISEQAAFAPVLVPGGPVTSGPAPTLPSTGLPVGVATLSLLLVGGALVLRRRMTAQL